MPSMKISLVLGLLLLSSSSQAENKVDMESWANWRGPMRTGEVQGTEWPQNFKKSWKLKWQKDLSPSYSGPILSDRYVFTTETVDKKKEVVKAFSRKDGSLIWETEWEGSLSVPFFARSNGSWIRSTPALYDGRLYVAGIRDVLVCLDAKSGDELWRVDFTKRFESPLPSFGFVCSPLVDKTGVYVQAGGSIVKLNRKTGETLWRTLKDGGGMWGSAFSSPYKATIHGKEQILVQSRTKLAGLTPDEGKILWSQDIPAFRGMNILTPSVQGNEVFTSSYGGGTFNIKIDFAGGNLTSQVKWKDPTQGYMSSPILYKGHAYIHLKNQRMACFNISDGKKTWTSKERFGKYVSFIRQKDRLLGLSEKGELLLIKANPEKFEIIDKVKVSDSSTWAHLAIHGDEVYIRSLNQLIAFKWSQESAPDLGDSKLIGKATD